MVNVKVFADKQTDRRTNGQTKKKYAPDLQMRGGGGIKSENTGNPFLK